MHSYYFNFFHQTPAYDCCVVCVVHEWCENSIRRIKNYFYPWGYYKARDFVGSLSWNGCCCMCSRGLGQAGIYLAGIETHPNVLISRGWRRTWLKQLHLLGWTTFYMHNQDRSVLRILLNKWLNLLPESASFVLLLAFSAAQFFMVNSIPLRHPQVDLWVVGVYQLLQVPKFVLVSCAAVTRTCDTISILLNTLFGRVLHWKFLVRSSSTMSGCWTGVFFFTWLQYSGLFRRNTIVDVLCLPNRFAGIYVVPTAAFLHYLFRGRPV